MTIFVHDELPIHTVPRMKTRIVADARSGLSSTAIWEQWIGPQGYIPLHYHNEEEVLVFLSGSILVTLGETTTQVTAPVTVVVPQREVHGLRPVGDEEVHLLAFFPVAEPKIYAPDGTLRPFPWEDRGASEAPP